MAQRVNFKLAYKGETYKFASAFKDDELFTAITQHVDKIVNERPYEMFWQDDESDVVLETSADLATAIDYAMSTMMSPTGTPCVRLTIGESKPIDAPADAGAKLQEEAPEAQPVANESAEAEAASEPSDPLPGIKEQLLQIFDSMLEQPWTVQIRSEMRTFLRMPNKKQKKQTKSFATRVVGQIATLVEKVPADLREQILQLTPHQLGELVLSDWLERVVEEKISAVKELPNSAEKVAAIREAESDIWLLLDLTNSDEENVYDDEYEKKVEDEEEFDPNVQYNINYEKLTWKTCQELGFRQADLTCAITDLMPNHLHAERFSRRVMKECAPHIVWPEHPTYRGEDNCTLWAKMIKKIDFTGDIKEFASEKHQQEMQAEIKKEIIRDLNRNQKKWKGRLAEWLMRVRESHSRGGDKMTRSLSWNYTDGLSWMSRLQKNKKSKKSKAKHVEYTPAQLSARLMIAYSAGLSSEALAKNLLSTNAKIVRPTEKWNDEVNTAPKMPDTSSLPQYLIDWADRQAAAILKTAQEKIALVLEWLVQNVPDATTDADVKPTSEELPRIDATPEVEDAEKFVQPVSKAEEVIEVCKQCRKQNSEEIEDLIAMKRELQIREKALQLKEEAFERKVATYEVKMEEFDEKFINLDKRVEKIEDATATEDLEAKMNEMEERLKNVEVKKEEDDDIVIV